MSPIPKATADPVIVTRPMWNALVDAIEALNRWTVAPPLELRQSAAGRALSVRLGRQAVVVKITGNAAGGGCYTGRILAGPCTAVGTSNLAMPEGMIVPAADDAVVINLGEDGAGTHSISAGTYLTGVVAGMSGSAKIVAVKS